MTVNPETAGGGDADIDTAGLVGEAIAKAARIERPINHAGFIGDDDGGDDAAHAREINLPEAVFLRRPAAALETLQADVDEQRALKEATYERLDAEIHRAETAEAERDVLKDVLKDVLQPFAKAYLKSLPYGSRGYGGCPWWQKVASSIAVTDFELAAVALDINAPRIDGRFNPVGEYDAPETDWRERAEAAEAELTTLRNRAEEAEKTADLLKFVDQVDCDYLMDVLKPLIRHPEDHETLIWIGVARRIRDLLVVRAALSPGPDNG